MSHLISLFPNEKINEMHYNILSSIIFLIWNLNILWIKIYDNKSKKETPIEIDKNILIEDEKKKYNSVKKQKVNNLIQSSKSSIKDKVASKREDEINFENEEDVLDDAFSELL